MRIADNSNGPGIRAKNGAIKRDGELVINKDNPKRPILVSELLNKLYSRNLNIGVSKFIADDSGKNIGIVNKEGTWKNVDFKNMILVDDIPLDHAVCAPVSERLKTIDSEYTQFMNMIEYNKKVDLYNSSKMTVDVLTGAVSFNMVEPEEYTNSVDLTRLTKRLKYSENATISGRVELSVKYSLLGNSTLFGEDLTFEAFTFKNNTKDSADFTSDLEGVVEVEYVNGIVRAFPISDKVGECIISSCVVTYDKLQNS